MKNLSFNIRLLYPALICVLIYGTIRLITDAFAGQTHIRAENAGLILIEFGVGLIATYTARWAFLKYENYLDNRPLKQITKRQIMLDFLGCWGIMLVLTNLIITPMVALTDDGCSTSDLVVINIVPTLIVLLWFAIRRGNRYLEDYTNNRLQLEQVKNEKLEGELKWLRSQIQPHFLFNALNTIYFQADEDVEAAKTTVQQLSQLLRHSLYESEKEQVLLSKEMEYIKNYIAIQKTRKSADLQLITDLEVEPNGHQIAPHLFVPLVENAFKYVGGKEKKYIHIDLSFPEDQIVFKINNSIPKKIVKRENGGIGLTNLKRRLELLYPNQYELNIEQRKDHFEVQLSLIIQN
ncbi:MAG: histidine kinase [Bacteroidota bacterium]